jgi:hypothetical protein
MKIFAIIHNDSETVETFTKITQAREWLRGTSEKNGMRASGKDFIHTPLKNEHGIVVGSLESYHIAEKV